MRTRLWAYLLNQRAKKDSDRVIASLGIKPGDVIADIGAWGGYFALRFAGKTGPAGTVYAVDINAAMRAYIEKKARKREISNVETLPGDREGKCLPAGKCDLIFMRNVFHHIAGPIEYFRHLKQGLKPGGRIAILEWREGKGGHVSRMGHTTPETVIRDVMAAAGLDCIGTYRFLEGQSFHIYG